MTAGFLTPQDIAAVPPGLVEALVSKRRACAVRVRPDYAVTIAAERLPEWLAIDPAAALEPCIDAPPSRASRVWTRADALVEMLRGRLTLTGPITALAIAESLGISVSDADQALLALEGDGWSLRGSVLARRTRIREPRIPNPGSRRRRPAVEWCDRSLLSRIHRYTLNRLRAEIEPVSASDFMRFLFAWQHVDPAAQLTSIDGLREIVAMLDGFELAASAWERAVLPARIERVRPAAARHALPRGRSGMGAVVCRRRSIRSVPRGLSLPRPSRCFSASMATCGSGCATTRNRDRMAGVSSPATRRPFSAS